MRILIALAFLIFNLPCLATSSDSITVEDDDLSEIPIAVQQAILAMSDEPITDFDGAPCKFVGKPIDLSGSGENNEWAITTASACSWAASAAPVWIVVNQNNSYTVVLDFMTYSLTLGKRRSHGFKHIVLLRATAARTEESFWKFDGATYQLIRMLSP